MIVDVDDALCAQSGTMLPPSGMQDVSCFIGAAQHPSCDKGAVFIAVPRHVTFNNVDFAAACHELDATYALNIYIHHERSQSSAPRPFNCCMATSTLRSQLGDLVGSGRPHTNIS